MSRLGESPLPPVFDLPFFFVHYGMNVYISAPKHTNAWTFV